MAIDLQCPGCGERLRVSDNSAGKNAKCPKCQAVFPVPALGTAGTSPASSLGPEPRRAEPVATPEPAPAAQMWRMKTPTGQSYGPVSRQELDSWVTEGRISEDCQVLAEGSDQWQWARDVFPALAIPSGTGYPGAADASVRENPTSGFPVIDISPARGSQSGGRGPSSQTHIVIQQQSDPAGVISLIMAILAFLLIIVGCLSCGVTGFVVYPLATVMAVIGAIAGFFARGNLQVAGILLNVLLLIPAALMMIMVMMGLFAAGAAGAG